MRDNKWNNNTTLIKKSHWCNGQAEDIKLNPNGDAHLSFSEGVQFKQTNKPKDNEVYGCPHLISKTLRDNERNDDTTLIKTRHVISATAKKTKLVMTSAKSGNLLLQEEITFSLIS